jgi:hypothetical protein
VEKIKEQNSEGVLPIPEVLRNLPNSAQSAGNNPNSSLGGGLLTIFCTFGIDFV